MQLPSGSRMRTLGISVPLSIPVGMATFDAGGLDVMASAYSEDETVI